MSRLQMMNQIAVSAVFLTLWLPGLACYGRTGGGEEVLASHFICKKISAGRYKPAYLKVTDDGSSYIDYSLKPKGLLGQNAMTSLTECEAALDAAANDFGVICSRTGLDGWKPTLYTGTVPGRPDFGYLGGSSIVKFENCLMATRLASAKGVCYWGGSEWYVSAIDRHHVQAGPFKRLDLCTAYTAALPAEF